MDGMRSTLWVFIALELPALFLFAFTVIFLRRKPPECWLSKLLAFEFPLIAVGGVGLPLWMAYQVLGAVAK